MKSAQSKFIVNIRINSIKNFQLGLIKKIDKVNTPTGSRILHPFAITYFNHCVLIAFIWLRRVPPAASLCSPKVQEKTRVRIHCVIVSPFVHGTLLPPPQQIILLFSTDDYLRRSELPLFLSVCVCV